MSNPWTRHLPITDGPWRIQDPHRGIVVDGQDRVIARVPKAGAVPFAERAGNLNTIARTPELLALARSCAYILDELGYPLKQEYYELLNACTPDAAALVPKRDRDTVLNATCDIAKDDDCGLPIQEAPMYPIDSSPLPQVPDPTK